MYIKLFSSGRGRKEADGSVSLPKDRDNASLMISKLHLARLDQLGEVEAFFELEKHVWF
jgi:hypothetical protein